MADFSLFPDTKAMTIATGFFLANFYVVKKLVTEPYLKLVDKRAGLTTGEQSRVEKLKQEISQMEESIATRLQAVRSEVRAFQESSFLETDKQCENAQKEAQSEASEHMEQLRGELKQWAMSEQSKIPAEAKALSQKIYQRLLA